MRPTYLAHPVTGEAMLFDVPSEAVCPDCGARYRRTLNVKVIQHAVSYSVMR